jgi:hypothetical protein
MTSEKKLLSPKQRKGFGYVLLIFGIAYMIYAIQSTKEGSTALAIAPGVSLLIIGSVLLNKEKVD